MKIFWALMRRELSAFFFSLTGYVVIAAVTFLTGLIFKVLIESLGGNPFPMPVTQLFFQTFLFWMILPLVTPIITMRIFALEKFSGTFETLMTTPVSDMQVVAAKFSAALVFYMVMWLPLLGGLLIVRHFANQPGAIDAGDLGGLYLGLFLVGGLFLSIGCFASALTRSQMVAAVLSLALGLSVILVSYLSNQASLTGWQAQVLYFFDLQSQVNDFVRGVIDTRTVIFYVSLMSLFLFLTLRVVESRRWK
ncbi:MAG TPA: ABC transporter permease subunit [Verrucomicrobiae bacterium]|jgi:ABC-2 type transport system permease protein